MKKCKTCKGCHFVEDDRRCYLGFEVERKHPYPSSPLEPCHKTTSFKEYAAHINNNGAAHLKSDAVISHINEADKNDNQLRGLPVDIDLLIHAAEAVIRKGDERRILHLKSIVERVRPQYDELFKERS